MRLLVYSMNYAPEIIGTGKYSGEMSEWLAGSGVDVRVIAAPPYYPEWRIQSAYRSWSYKKESIRGVSVWRCPVWVPGKPTGLKRILCLTSFAISSFPIALRLGFWRPDVVLVVEPPIACIPGALLAGRIGRSKLWLHVQDFEVDAAFDLGLIKSGSGKKLLTCLEAWLMSKFDRVSSISTRMCERLSRKGVREDKQLLVRNWIDAAQFVPIGRDEAFRREVGIPKERSVALYSGNMGQKQGLETVIEAARLLRNEEIVFVMCGDGAARPRLMELGTDLKNICWLPLQPDDKFRKLLDLADIHLLPQRADVADLVMPSKLGAMLASRRPVVAMARAGTEVAEVVGRRGVVVEPEDADAFAQAIKALALDQGKRDELGRLGRVYAEEVLDKEHILRKLLNELSKLQLGNIPQNSRD